MAYAQSVELAETDGGGGGDGTKTKTELAETDGAGGGGRDAKTYKYRIKIKTGKYLGQTITRHGNARVQLFGKERCDQNTYTFPGRFFRPGVSETRTVKSVVADIKEVEIWMERIGNYTKLKWFVESITIQSLNDGETQIYPFQRWITMRHQVIQLDDSLLPQNDKNAERRSEGILLDKDWYYFTNKAADCIPVMTNVKITSEYFSIDYFVNVFLKEGIFNNIKELLIPLVTCRWRHLTDTDDIYERLMLRFKKPKCVDKYIAVFKQKDWSALDEVFGAQRLIGTNPAVIRRVTTKAITDTIPVDEDRLKQFMENLSLDDAIRQKRLFMVDYTEILHEVPCTSNLITAPIALFFVTGGREVKDKKLMPVAIQLFKRQAKPNKGEDNPVFYPNDDKYTWFLAKMWFNNADASYHESVSHLGFTHLVMETAYLALRQTVSLSHPLYRLMAPHFLYLISINMLAWDLLLSKGGWVDKSMSIGVKGMLEIIHRRYEGIEGAKGFLAKPWRLDTEGNVEADVKDREVEDLPNYTFRDDALDLHRIIRKYVKTVVEHHYEDPEFLEQDYEIQDWVKMMCKETDKGGCGIKGVPSDPIAEDPSTRKFSTVDQVIDTVTSMIYISSVGHASVNFLQYEEYGYPLNYPALLYGDPPRNNKDVRTEQDIIQVLPTKPRTLGTMNITQILSQRQTKPLGDFEIQYQFDHVGRNAVKVFREDLHELQVKLKRRNENEEDPYDVLYPDDIPNAISI